MLPTPAGAVITTTPLPKLVLISLAATSIEWYDFFLYGTAAALVFPTTFFAGTLSPSVALIASFGTFAVGFVARPVGAVVFGHFGDWKGRKSALVTALYLMGGATTYLQSCLQQGCDTQVPRSAIRSARFSGADSRRSLPRA